MPKRVDLQCLACDHVWEDLIGDQFGPAGNCPRCDAVGPEELIGAANFTTRYCCGEDSGDMGAGEISMHLTDKARNEEAARNGTLNSCKIGKRTPVEFRPVFDKRIF